MQIEMPRAHRRFGGRRWNVVWPASLVAGGREYPCTILDLSRTGARIEGNGLPKAEGPTMLRCEHFGALEAHVKWVRGTKAGLRFERMSADVMEILQRVVPGIGRSEAAPKSQPERASFGRRRSTLAA